MKNGKIKPQQSDWKTTESLCIEVHIILITIVLIPESCDSSSEEECRCDHH